MTHVDPQTTTFDPVPTHVHDPLMRDMLDAIQRSIAEAFGLPQEVLETVTFGELMDMQHGD